MMTQDGDVAPVIIPGLGRLEWIAVEGHEDYLVSNTGEVFSRRSGQYRRLKPQRDGHGYLTIRPQRRGKRLPIHHLVLLTFVGPRPKGAVCRHLDNDHTNNHADNLVWGTQKENIGDQARHGTRVRGEAKVGAKLTADAVRAARVAHADGCSPSYLARVFKVSQAAMRHAVLRNTWAHVV